MEQIKLIMQGSTVHYKHNTSLVKCMTHLVVLQKLFQLPAVVDFILSCFDWLEGVEDVKCPQVQLMLEEEEL